MKFNRGEKQSSVIVLLHIFLRTRSGSRWLWACTALIIQIPLCSNYIESFARKSLCVGLAWVGRLIVLNTKNMHQTQSSFRVDSRAWAGPSSTVQRPWRYNINRGTIGHLAQQEGWDKCFIASLIQCNVMIQQKPRVWQETYFIDLNFIPSLLILVSHL